VSLEISPESRTSPNSLIRVSVQSRIALISEYSPNSLVFSTTKVAHLRITRTGFQNPSNCLSGKFLPEFSKVRIVPLPAPAAGSSKSAHLRQLLPEISMFGTGLRPVYTTTVRLTRLAATSTCRPPAGLSGRWRSPAAAEPGYLRPPSPLTAKHILSLSPSRIDIFLELKMVEYL